MTDVSAVLVLFALAVATRGFIALCERLSKVKS
jgi:hypothetical protein